MRTTLQNRRFVVIDDLLPAREFRSICSYMEVEQYSWVHALRWQKVWHLMDGAPLSGPVVHSHDVGDKGLVYPTGGDIDALIATILDRAHEFEDLVGIATKSESRAAL